MKVYQVITVALGALFLAGCMAGSEDFRHWSDHGHSHSHYPDQQHYLQQHN